MANRMNESSLGFARRSAVAMAVGLMVASGAVYAQSNATGSLFGNVQVSGATTVTIENTATGLKRTLTPDASGRVQATSLPTGVYRVSLVKDGKIVQTLDAVEVRIGQGAEIVFNNTLDTVTVTGARKTIDVSNTNNSGATFTAKQLDNLPVGRTVEAVVQLAPNTTRGDTRFGNGNTASFGGGAVSENSYYINGFPVVNPLTGLGASQLPFGAIDQAQVLVGGFGAEFGRSVGGVVNITTKSGTNQWEAGVSVSVAPASFRNAPKNFNYGNTKYNPATDGKLRNYREQNTLSSNTYGGYVGGPLIKDKLFLFAAAEQLNTKSSFLSTADGFVGASAAALKRAWVENEYKITRSMLKMDWLVTDEHRLEFTSIGDSPVSENRYFGWNPTTRQRDYVLNTSNKLSNVDDNGGQLNMFKYTGNLTSDLTLTAIYGQNTSKHENEYAGFDPNKELFTVSAPANAQMPGVVYNNPQPISGNVLAPGSKDVVKSFRFDLEYILGKHTIRGGLDKNKIQSIAAGEFKAGGGTWFYYKTDTPNEPVEVSGGVVPAPGGQGYYVGKGLFTDVTDSYGEQSAFYVEDKFQVTKDLLVVGGLRNESFKNQNGDRQTFLEMKGQINPRLAFSYDARGDGTLKLFGTAGRYSVPIPTHITVRGAGRSTFTEQFYTYTGVDPVTGAPTGLKQLTAPLSGNNEFGQEKDIKSLAALNMKPSYQDEFSAGFEHALSSSYNVGGRFTYRSLKSTIDDFCDVRPFEKWAADHKIEITNPLWGNTCQTFNPGQDNTFLVDFKGTGKDHSVVALTAAEQGFEKVKRTYKAIDVFVEHPLKNGWYGKVAYTWSKNMGNTEGQVRSDNGQADVAVTSVWDYPELMIGAYGPLPNDRKHQIKAFGFVDVGYGWNLGANLLMASGRPRSCLGSQPSNPTGSPNYANQHFYCLGDKRANNVLVPRGTLGRLSWDNRLDVNVVYKPSIVKGLALRMDIFNVFNKQTVTSVEERYNNGTQVRNTYELPLSMTVPRSFKFTASYDHKF